jgi:hypothetical protein
MLEIVSKLIFSEICLMILQTYINCGYDDGNIQI